MLGTARFWCEATIVMLAAFMFAGGCDWFKSPSEINILPETSITLCPAGEILAGDDVTITWTGDDADGSVASFEWTLDDTLAGETSDVSKTIEDVTEGTHTFTVAAVDDDGGVDATPATCTFTASASGGLVDRVVLAELLTTKFCSNCWKAELALNRMLTLYGRDELTVVSYDYDDDDNIPPDPVATDESNARCDWYYENTDIGDHYAVFPLTVFDGGRFLVGAPDTTAAKTDYAFEIDLRRTVGSPLSMELSGDIAGGRGDVTVVVRVHDALTGGPHVLRTVVVEDGIIDGTHHFDFVARDILDEEVLTVSAVGDSAAVDHSFTVEGGWDIDELDVVAFVQDDSTGEILQSGRLLTE